MQRQWRTHKRLWKLSGGRLGGKIKGLPVIELITTGRTSGQARSILIFSCVHEGHQTIVGTNAGLDVDPAWVRNLRANPKAVMRTAGNKRNVTAQFLEGQAWQKAWEAALAFNAGYRDYEATLTRPIPIVRLLPAS
jgi:F420H(2)-dependent quinone reductase